MITPRHYRTRSTAGGNYSSTPRNGIQRYFRGSQRVSPGAILAAPRAPRSPESTVPDSPRSSTSPATTDCPQEAQRDCSAKMASSHLQPSGVSDDIREILQALPTKSDIEALILRIEEAHSRDIQEVRGDLHALTNRVDSGEATISSLTHRIEALERSQVSQMDTAIDLQLHLEDLEDRSRSNNLRLRGLPEATGTEDLAATVNAIFQEVLGASPPPSLEMDRVHRTLGPKSQDPDRPRDVLCRVHHYNQKELILRRAWEHGAVEFDGATIKILPDLSRATLQRRAMLRPILDLARRQDCTYRWGFPLAVIFRKSASSFTLRTPADLPALFVFLGAEPIHVPNWLAILPRNTGRPGSSALRTNQPPRQQRSRRRNRSPSAEGSRES